MKRLLVYFLFFFLLLPKALLADYDVWNTLLGMQFINEDGVWRRREFEQFFNGKYGFYFQGDPTLRTAGFKDLLVLQCKAVEMRCHYDKTGKLAIIDVIFVNKGDSADAEHLKNLMRKTARTISEQLSGWGGTPERCDYGHRKMQQSARKWSGKNVEFFLEYIRNEYVILHIHFKKVYSAAAAAGSNASNTAGKNQYYTVKGKDFTNNIKRNDFGDVYIDNIPMVNQGSKGYCVPATVERVLRYYGITNVNMHQLADAAKTKKGGGTYVKDAMRAINSVRKSAGLRASEMGDVKLKMVQHYIEKGVPIFWVMFTNREYENIRRKSLNDRKHASPDSWQKLIAEYKVPAGGSSHMCLIVGYNELTREIAVSNSWGDRELVPTWVPIKVAAKVSQKSTVVLEPR